MPSVQDIYVQRAGDSYPAHWLYMSCNQIIVALQTGEEGIIFIGPKVEHLIMFGDKINARIQAKKAGIQYIPGSDGRVESYEEVENFAKEVGLPIMLKAVNGGGGALDLLGLPANRCCCVEDSVPGITAGKRAGLTVIAKREERFGFSQDAADKIIDQLPELLTLS